MAKLNDAKSYDAAYEKQVRTYAECTKCKAKKGADNYCTTYRGKATMIAHADRKAAYGHYIDQKNAELHTALKAEPAEVLVASSAKPSLWDNLVEELRSRGESSAVKEMLDNLRRVEVTQQLIDRAQGMTARDHNMQLVEAALWKLYQMKGDAWLITRMAQLIVDKEDWLEGLISE